MTAPGDPRVLADVGGLVVAERGPLVVVVDRRTGSWATLAFVLGVLATVFGLFGVATLGFDAAGTPTVPWPVSAGALVVGLVFGTALWGAITRIRRANRTSLDAYRPVAVFDRARREFVDADGMAVCALDDVRFHRETQLTSSSPMLVASTPAGRRIIKRGNPFNGGLGDLDAVLTTAVFGPPS
ncbi:hypothetical protein [Mycolicibacterium sediminis]|uniref:Uncharacterized protein n=1 Tax=Mycolicibacterium sediminis TaxID=1286180 RepID=A0A7I7QTG2_9MYCO|nr:hypothetical protein [Mycolicibacterium sediminis]BBY29594.1 hypothetical protein MSEDJ_36900 [Mycolicibacterium sediminis]